MLELIKVTKGTSMLRLSRIAILIVMTASPLAARDIYVDNLAGDDLLSGATPAPAVAGDGPVQTIARAMRMAQPHDRVVLANTGTPYRETVSLSGRHGGSRLEPFVL